jgi:hypothetical protein
MSSTNYIGVLFARQNGHLHDVTAHTTAATVHFCEAQTWGCCTSPVLTCIHTCMAFDRLLRCLHCCCCCLLLCGVVHYAGWTAWLQCHPTAAAGWSGCSQCVWGVPLLSAHAALQAVSRGGSSSAAAAAACCREVAICTNSDGSSANLAAGRITGYEQWRRDAEWKTEGPGWDREGQEEEAGV